MNILNKLRLGGLFAVLIALFGGVGLYFGGAGGLIMGLVFALLMNGVSYFYSHKIVVKMHRAQPMEGDTKIHTMVEELATKAGIPEPELYVMDTKTPNAFATGRNPKHGVVCVTTGLMQNLSDDEIEGVLAHEIAHIKNRDTLIQAVAGTIAGGISILAQMLMFSTMSGEQKNPMMAIAGMVLAPIAASVIKMAISRSREFSADATAATFTEPRYLADALKSIDRSVQQAPMEDGARGASHMFIINPFGGDSLSKLFSTHPPTEERIRRLEQQ
ncbi:MAG: zinc metalloprotease HtpX [Candidatus Nanohaloarchaeota archaeon QJJ-5]|nr:zinc metalloprotease HtpX [Candidatus Nanohaloarchaeota archaeon QJJ-5]